jgi:hypothetical protein
MKINKQGSLEEVTLLNTKVYLIFTRAWNYRGGKIYDVEKKFTLANWKVTLTTCENGQDVSKEYLPWEIITIPAWIPNIFYFGEDSEMIEWFSKEATSTYFERYKKIKDESLQRVNETLKK